MTARRLPAHARRVLAALLVVALGGWEPFRTADPDVEAGNQAYAEGRYDDALAAYDRAARRAAVDGDGLAFDRGTALLKKADATRDPAQKQQLIERALEDLKQAGRARDPRIRGGAHYNRGNLLMSQDKLDDAIEAYKQALRDEPALDDARYNLELALHRRRKQQQARQGQQGQGQQGQGQQGQGGRNGQGQQGAGPQGQGGPGQGQPGQGAQGANPPGNGSPPGAPPDSANGSGASPPDGGNGSSASPPGGANSPGNAQGGGNNPGNPPGNGSGANPPPGANPGDGRIAPRGRPQRGRGPPSPRTPTEGKLDDLDNYSRRLQKDEARRRATGRTSDPQHDW